MIPMVNRGVENSVLRLGKGSFLEGGQKANIIDYTRKLQESSPTPTESSKYSSLQPLKHSTNY